MIEAGRGGRPIAAGFVLAGGQSSRMGTDKALLHLAGQPLIVHALNTLSAVGLNGSIAGARSPLTAFAPVISDAGVGPLSGICAALESCEDPLVVFLSVDLPLFPSSAMTYLLQHTCFAGAAATVFSLNGFVQTFPVVLDRVLLPTLRARLTAHRGGCLTAIIAGAESVKRPLQVLPAELLAQAGQCMHPQALPPFLWFLNLNTPSDLAQAQRLLVPPVRVS